LATCRLQATELQASARIMAVIVRFFLIERTKDVLQLPRRDRAAIGRWQQDECDLDLDLLVIPLYNRHASFVDIE